MKVNLWLALGCAALTPGCMSITDGTGNGTSSAGGTTSGSSGSTSASGSGAPAATGANCGTDPTTGATLCLGISLCPQVPVDPDLLPNCGYRVHADVLDLECVCDDQICPIGVPATCAEAQQLLNSGQSTGTVCEQVNEGRCTMGMAVDAGGSATCDPSCRASCDNVPTCVQACGC